ncbi:hypothetical protein C882_0299 [Caenispirillum salinarum AK4]|uniref:Uncharacterized protein n=1 Tax=Caenispirillum salinarum AK4 TaxID=1238182 RepID=K9GW47_9PROT|nr:hypothetical protein C882_0299 [Caenispirillum salinarum AK4]
MKLGDRGLYHCFFSFFVGGFGLVWDRYRFMAVPWCSKPLVRERRPGTAVGKLPGRLRRTAGAGRGPSLRKDRS